MAEMQHPDAPSDVLAWSASPPKWVQQMAVQHLDESLAVELGLGEREAISLALELNADVLLIDELAGRRQAEARHIVVTGTLAVLLQASLRGYCDFPEALKQLRRCGFWVSASTEALMMTRYEKARTQ